MKIMAMLLAGALMLTTGNLLSASGAEDSIEPLHLSSDTLQARINAPDKGIPEEVLNNAKCIVVVPHLVKGAFVIGGQHGRGIATCRTKEAEARRHLSPSAEEVGDCRLALKASIS